MLYWCFCKQEEWYPGNDPRAECTYICAACLGSGCTGGRSIAHSAPCRPVPSMSHGVPFPFFGVPCDFFEGVFFGTDCNITLALVSK